MRNANPKSYDYIAKLLPAESPAMLQARKNSESLGLEGISLSPAEGGLIKFHASDVKARKIVEIGTLTGLSALYLLAALPEEGLLWTIEKSPEHASLAEQVLKPFIDKKQCRLLVGDAREELAKISADGPFDVVFIDGNKAAYLDYFNWAVTNIRAGGVIIADNIFLAGAVWGDQTQQRFNEKQIRNVNKMNELAFSNAQLQSVIVPTSEGLLICKKMY